MSRLPRTTWPDATLALGVDPYRFISQTARRLGTDAFLTRILFQRTICLTGRAAAELFYDRSKFTRVGAAPTRVQKTLFGVGGVQNLDGPEHQKRKAMFLALVGREAMGALADRVDAEWQRAATRWSAGDRIVLYDETRALLTRAVCAWAGLPLEEREVGTRTAQLSAMFALAGTAGPKHWWSRTQRTRGDRWIAGLIERVRAGTLDAPAGSALRVLAEFRDAENHLLDARTAAVELINMLRPTVAVSVFIALAAHALHEHAPWRERVATDAGDRERFVQEVRRWYPFFPAVVGKTRDAFEWNGLSFPANTRTMLDIYGTNHDGRDWESPGNFDPDRFKTWDGSAFNFIPQGGGDHAAGHRCPGEWLTIELMQRAVVWLTTRLAYDVPPQELSIRFRTLPALPRSGFVMAHVRPLAPYPARG